MTKIMFPRDLNDYILREKNKGNREFRISLTGDYTAIIHPLGSDGETVDFFLIPTDRKPSWADPKQ